MERILMTATSIEPEDEPYVNEALKLIGASGRKLRAPGMNTIIRMEQSPDRMKDAFHEALKGLKGAKVIPLQFSVPTVPKITA